MLTSSQIKANIDAMESQGASRDEIQGYLNTIPKPTVTAAPQASSLVRSPFRGANPFNAPTTQLGQTIQSNVASRISNIATEINRKGQNPIVSGVKATAQGFNILSDTAGSLIKATPVVGPVAQQAGNLIGQGFSKVVDYSRPIGNRLLQLEQENPQAAKFITDFLEAASASGEISGNILLAQGVKSAGATTAKKTSELYQTLTTRSEATIEKAIVKNFTKGVKPQLPGKASPTKLREYNDDIVQAVNVIKNNKQNLKFVDDGGDAFVEPIVGKSPRTLQQLTDAIEQTKKTVFSEYDALAKQAGKAGVGVELSPIAKELNAVINNKALRFTSPKAVAHAKRYQQQLLENGRFDATTAQEVIQNFNKSLEAFYRNPTYDSASQAAIDAMIANRMRMALDQGITGLTGKQYAALKQQYGSLKAIEKDVLKATLRDARKNVKGLIDFSDIFSGGQVVSGILSLNPAIIASGITQKAIAQYIKFLNNPNRAIEQVFKQADKLP